MRKKGPGEGTKPTSMSSEEAIVRRPMDSSEERTEFRRSADANLRLPMSRSKTRRL